MEVPVKKPETVAEQPYSLGDPECHQVLKVVRTYSRRYGTHRQDLEDDALGFLARILKYLECHPEIDPSVILSPAWLDRAAANWTKNCLRTQWLRQNRESLLPIGSAEEQEGESFPSELISHEPSPDTQAVRADFCRRLHAAIATSRLTPAQFEVLNLFMDGESVIDIAQRLHVSTDTIRHRLRKIWALLRSSLRRHGIGDAEVAAFLADS
ncbi:MAG: hypothetical protein JWL77_2549 [Chthonomonadaceae bacterium]|nr:hypothetical protein [Chthonomonadaceae bacterium]